MYVCVYACVYVYMHVCVCMHVFVWVYVCLCVCYCPYPYLGEAASHRLVLDRTTPKMVISSPLISTSLACTCPPPACTPTLLLVISTLLYMYPIIIYPLVISIIHPFLTTPLCRTRKQDPQGREYYIDKENKRTQWRHPYDASGISVRKWNLLQSGEFSSTHTLTLPHLRGGGGVVGDALNRTI